MCVRSGCIIMTYMKDAAGLTILWNSHNHMFLCQIRHIWTNNMKANILTSNSSHKILNVSVWQVQVAIDGGTNVWCNCKILIQFSDCNSPHYNLYIRNFKFWLYYRFWSCTKPKIYVSFSSKINATKIFISFICIGKDHWNFNILI